MTCPHKENCGPAFSLIFQKGSLKSWQLTCKSPGTGILATSLLHVHTLLIPVRWRKGGGSYPPLSPSPRQLTSALPDVNPFLLCNAEDNLLLRNRYSHTNIC